MGIDPEAKMGSGRAAMENGDGRRAWFASVFRRAHSSQREQSPAASVAPLEPRKGRGRLAGVYRPNQAPESPRLSLSGLFRHRRHSLRPSSHKPSREGTGYQTAFRPRIEAGFEPSSLRRRHYQVTVHRASQMVYHILSGFRD
ncbi:hypothetical protein GQ53DRAFT_190771 [Thozetella sp. PMI_491]|nr:hypothetical protein GQ53DRAFT_190771 [Thozetella sp. PMI_491]